MFRNNPAFGGVRLLFSTSRNVSNPIRRVPGVSPPSQYFLDLTTPRTRQRFRRSLNPVNLLALEKPSVLLIAQRDERTPEAWLHVESEASRTDYQYSGDYSDFGKGNQNHHF